MKIIKEINDTEFVVKLEPQDYEESRELNVVIAHDYVQFGRKMRLFTRTVSRKPTALVVG